MTFHVGQKIVCVDDDVFEGDPQRRLFTGQIYTVARTYPQGSTSGNTKRYGPGVPCIDLLEVQRVDHVPYAAARFRPVVERKTDISIFQAMLSPSDERVMS